MSRRAQTDMAVLGALSLAPMTAYAMREAIRDVLGQFWSESFGQIYPALSALERAGLVRRRAGARAGTSTFEITTEGTVRLQELLGEPLAPTPPRNGLLLRLFFGRTLGPEACRALLAAAADEAQKSLDDFEALEARVVAEDAGSPDLVYALITVSAGRHSALARRDWARSALARLDADAEAGGPPSNPAPSPPKEPHP